MNTERFLTRVVDAFSGKKFIFPVQSPVGIAKKNLKANLEIILIKADQ